MAEIPYTVRLAPELLEQIERTARARGIAARKLIRTVLAERFCVERRAHPDEPTSEPNQQRTLHQILFDLTRTRLTLQHLLARSRLSRPKLRRRLVKDLGYDMDPDCALKSGDFGISAAGTVPQAATA